MLKVNVVRAYTFYDYPLYDKVSKCKKTDPFLLAALKSSIQKDKYYFFGALSL